jgi:guanosine-3',5'-bis(diphosphate) 3'-pyrophosphohydrolase
MNISDTLDDIGLERRRRLLGLLEPDPHALVLWDRAMAALPDDAERSRLAQAFRFAKEIKYRHVGLTSDIYFSHPLRVAALAILISGAQDAGTGVLAVLHNVLEVSDVSAGTLSETFGSGILNQIETLTVDREVQWDKTYKAVYYGKLMEGPPSARLVKIVDKLDNLFVLGVNPDATVREKYLAEIEDFVLPMTEASLPGLTAYMRDLVRDCRATGFIERPVATNLKEET